MNSKIEEVEPMLYICRVHAILHRKQFATSSDSIVQNCSSPIPRSEHSAAFFSVLGRGMKKSSFSSAMARKRWVGWRFHPSDEELVDHYLRLKNQGQDDAVQKIPEIPICQYEPWNLPGQSKISSDDRYFFSPRDYKYKKSKRSNRTTKTGYWKPTGKLSEVMSKSKKKKIGSKRTLVFYSGRPHGTRTGWVMQEYECTSDSNSTLHDQGDFVLNKLKWKPDEKTSKGEPNQCTAVVAPDFQNQDPIHQQAYHMSCDVENNEVNDTSNEVKSINGTSHSILSNFENQTSVPRECTPPRVILSGFKYQSSHKKDDCLMISNWGNQITTYGEGELPPMVTPSEFNQTPYRKGDWLLDSDLENHKSPYVKDDSLLISSSENQVSASGDGELSPSMISFDYSCKSPYEKSDCLFSSDLKDQISDSDIKCLLASSIRPPYDLEDQSIYDKDDCLKASDLVNPTSDNEFGECEQNYPSPPPPSFGDQSNIYKGEPNNLWAYYSKSISSVDKANILVSKEGESSSLEATPSDFANQNQFQKTDKQNLFGVGMFDSELMANLPAEPQCTINPEP